MIDNQLIRDLLAALCVIIALGGVVTVYVAVIAPSDRPGPEDY